MLIFIIIEDEFINVFTCYDGNSIVNSISVMSAMELLQRYVMS